MTRQKVEPTLARYGVSTTQVILRIVLVLAILSVFGIETTSFAALLAAAGIAIGAAWAGLLANFAAGVFLVLFRPFKVGDFVAAGGVTGTVREIGLFSTTIDQPDNVRTTVGNNRILGDNIANYAANPHRRVDLTAQLAHGVDPLAAMKLLAARVAQIPNVAASPAPEVEILEFNATGTKLVVRPCCANEHYWQVYFDTNKAILAAGAEAGWPVPAPQQVIRQAPAASPVRAA
jgi:small conductance mechanosensitive channel